MTNDEKQQERASLLLEIDQSEGDLVYLRERAFRFAGYFRDAADKLEQSAKREPSESEFRITGDDSLRLNPNTQSMLNHGGTVKLIEELKDARVKYYQLTLRKENLAGNIRL